MDEAWHTQEARPGGELPRQSGGKKKEGRGDIKEAPSWSETRFKSLGFGNYSPYVKRLSFNASIVALWPTLQPMQAKGRPLPVTSHHYSIEFTAKDECISHFKYHQCWEAKGNNNSPDGLMAEVESQGVLPQPLSPRLTAD